MKVETMKIGELREFFAKYPDETEVFAADPDGELEPLEIGEIQVCDVDATTNPKPNPACNECGHVHVTPKVTAIYTVEWPNSDRPGVRKALRVGWL